MLQPSKTYLNSPQSLANVKLENIMKNLKPVVPDYEGGASIEVTATGEISLLPDQCRVVISVSSSKNVVQDVKNSVKRRLDYVLQTLHNQQIRENDIHITETLQRIDSAFHLNAEVTILSSNFEKFQPVCNTIVEKLDDHVKVSSLEFLHSPQKRETARRQAALLAVKNCKLKAAELAQAVNARVGRVVTVREESCLESEGGATVYGEPMTIQQQIDQATIHICTKIFITFELRAAHKPKKS